MSDADGLNVVLGAGPVGLALVEELTARGRSVRLVSRSGASSVSEGVEVRAADLSDPANAIEACSGAAVVYQCLNPPYDRWPELFPPAPGDRHRGGGARGREARLDGERVHVRADGRGAAHGRHAVRRDDEEGPGPRPDGGAVARGAPGGEGARERS